MLIPGWANSDDENSTSPTRISSDIEDDLDTQDHIIERDIILDTPLGDGNTMGEKKPSIYDFGLLMN